MGKKQPSTTKQISEVKLPAWVEQASQENYNLAKNITSKPLVQYGGQEVAGLSNMTTDAFNLLMRNIGANDPLYREAARLQGRVEGLDPLYKEAYGLGRKINTLDPLYKEAYGMGRKVNTLDPIYQRAQGLLSKSAGPFDPTGYLNPYIQNVESRAIDNANRSLAQQIAANADAANKAKAFGGSRSGIVDAVTRAEGARGIGDLSAQLRKEGYDTATSNMFKDREAMRQAASGMITGAGQQAGGWLDAMQGILSGAGQQGKGWLDAMQGILSGAGQQGKGWLDAAQGLLGTGEARQNALYKDIAGMLGAGETERGYRQSLIDADRAKFEEARGYDLERLNTRLAALGMSPYGKTESTTKTGQQVSAGPDWATIGLGILKLIPGISDRRDKTDIKKIGVSKKTGLPLYAYRYKEDPKSYPKIVGPMAQDIEKKYPHLVHEVGGHKVVAALGMLSE